MRSHQKGAMDFMVMLAVLAFLLIGGLVAWRLLDGSDVDDATDKLGSSLDDTKNSITSSLTGDEDDGMDDDNENHNGDGDMDDSDMNENMTAGMTDEEKAMYEEKMKMVMIDEAVTVHTLADIDNLPEDTPESYRAYMTAKLNARPVSSNCVTSYVVTQVSDMNVGGKSMSVDLTTGESRPDCIGTVQQVWYADGDTWNEVDFQDAPSCDDVGTMVYGEFAAMCKMDDGTMKVNPNGYISS